HTDTVLSHYNVASRTDLRAPVFPYTTLFRSRANRSPTRRWAAAVRAGSRRWPARCKAGRAGKSCGAASGTGWTCRRLDPRRQVRSEEHTSELQSRFDLVCRLLLEKKKKSNNN